MAENAPSDNPEQGMSATDQAFAVNNATSPEPFQPSPEATRQPGIPEGSVTRYHHSNSKIYPGVERDYWVYVPPQYTPAKPACLMVFQDGEMYMGADINVPAVFDNMIAHQEIPVTIGVFVNPGDKGPGLPIWGGTHNRNFEYDSLGDTYARFMLEEILPEVEKNLSITTDPAGRAICGISSGGICAFTVGWERPDAFGKILTHCGSFTNILGGHVYPSLIRRNAAKSLRITLQTGSGDLDVVFGNWPLANQEMASALAYRGYDFKYDFAEGGRHSLKYGGSIFPDTLRWLWRDYEK